MWIKCLAEGQKVPGIDGNRTRNPLIQSQGFNPIYHGTSTVGNVSRGSIPSWYHWYDDLTKHYQPQICYPTEIQDDGVASKSRFHIEIAFIGHRRVARYQVDINGIGVTKMVSAAYFLCLYIMRHTFPLSSSHRK